MSQINLPETTPKANPVELTASAVNHLVRNLPSGTAYCIAIVFTVMMTGRLVSTKGSLALAVLPFVHQLKWGWHRVERAMSRGKVALDIVFIAGVRVGLVRRVRFDTSCEAAVAGVFDDLPKCQHNRLLVVDAGIATQEQFAAATEQNALVGRLRKNGKLRCAPAPKQKGKPGRPPKHGPGLHPGPESPECEPQEDFTLIEAEKHSHRSPVETNFFVAQDPAAMEMPRAWTENAIKRRIGLALLAGCLLKALSEAAPSACAAVCEPIATGPWDKKPQPTAGRLSHHLNVRVNDFLALTLKGVTLRNYRKIQKPQPIKDLSLLDAA